MIRLRRERNAHSLRHRLKRGWRQLIGADDVKQHVVHFMRIGEQTYKRIRFQSVSEAAAVETILERFGPTPALPACVTRHGKHLWLEFVRGEIFDSAAGDAEALLGHFFAELYRRDCRRVSIADTPLPARLERDLRFLAESKFLPEATAMKLVQRGRELEPDGIWMGYDYIDPLPKNFVVRDGHLVGIDVEALQSNVPLGTGPAKAILRWSELTLPTFLERLREAGSPDLREQFEYVELCFFSAYAKQKSFQKKSHLAPPRIFERFLR